MIRLCEARMQLKLSQRDLPRTQIKRPVSFTDERDKAELGVKLMAGLAAGMAVASSACKPKIASMKASLEAGRS